ncbi:MAG: hypothetical protein FJW26_12765 [Acidimicrobiia bacterium]|nr:hypothetical protein [Acidimicrobiia bacterium]
MWFLATDTARSRAYAQALAVHDMEPEGVILFGGSTPSNISVSAAGTTIIPFAGVHLPDVQIPLTETCRNLGWPLYLVSADNVNDPGIADALKRTAHWQKHSG